MGFDIGGVATLTAPGGNTLSLDGTVANVMKVNASGILTRSITPYMRGEISGQSGTYNAGGNPLLVTAGENVGSCWNNGNGLFTCPVAGYYMTAMCAIAGNASSGYLHVRKNNVTQHFTHWNHQGSWHFISLCAVLLAAANDYFSWHAVSTNPATAGVHGNGNHAMYSIALMA